MPQSVELRVFPSVSTLRTIFRLVAVLMLAVLPALGRELAITVDDLPSPDQATNRAMLDVLQAHRAPAVGFVNESRLHVEGERDARVALLRMWLDAGMTLGNHTFMHRDLNTTPLAQYQDDVIRGEVITRQLMRDRGHTRFYFRHPFTHSGATAEAKQGLEDFLASRGYTIAPFTIENSDYVFNAVYLRALSSGDKMLAEKVRAAYVAYNDVVFDYFERRSREVLGYEVRQIVLIHVNRINADCLDELLRKWKAGGYSFVTLERALEDKAYAIPDKFIGPQGLSWIHRWTVALGQQNRWQDEPDPPKWIMELYRASQTSAAR